MKYNKHKQPYEIIGRFQVFEGLYAVDYTRVRFSITGKEQVIPAYLEKKGDFQDLSLLEVVAKKVIKEINESPVGDSITSSIDTTSMTSVRINDLETRISTAESNITVTADVIDTKYDGTEYGVVQDDITSINEPELPVFIATNPKGEEIRVRDLEVLAISHNLDLEAIQDVLAGKQKTHKKWRFRAE